MRMTQAVEEALKIIFGAVVCCDLTKDDINYKEIMNTYKICLPQFHSEFPINIFQDEYAILYSIISSKGVKYFTIEQFNEIIDRNKEIVAHSPYVDVKKYTEAANGQDATDDEIAKVIQETMRPLLEELAAKVVNEDEFLGSCQFFKQAYKEDHYRQVIQNASMIMTDTGFKHNKSYRVSVILKGVESAQEYYRNEMQKLDALGLEHGSRSIILDDDWYQAKLNEAKNIKDDSLLDFGITNIDNSIGKLMRSHMLGILGPPKGGKTKFTNYLVARALEKKLDVLVWPLEGTKEEWIAMQQAYIIHKDHNKPVDSKAIQRRQFGKNKELAGLADTALSALVTDKRRGRLVFQDGAAYVEDFLDVLEGVYKNTLPYDVIAIDSLVNILSRSGKGKSERISEAYMMLKNFISFKLPKRQIALLPAQLKQSSIDTLRARPDDDIDVTAGGESAETIRSPDEVIGLFSSRSERESKRIKLYHVASRHSELFAPFYATAHLESCFFKDLEGQQ
jgi:hypothetical protein